MAEDLNVAGMTRSRRLARAVADQGFGTARRMLGYKTARNGGTLLVADRFYPSSKSCSGCGAVKAKLSLSERIYRCDACGLVADRDVNAARNLLSLAASGAESENARGCDTKSRLLSGSPERRPAYAGWLIPDQCQGSVPALACVAGNRGVRSPGKCPRAAVPPGGHRLGKAGRVNVSEPLMMPRQFYLPVVGCVAGGQGPAAARRQALVRDRWLTRTAPPSPGYRGHPPRS